MKTKNAWLLHDESERKEIFAYCEDYKGFLNAAKTERMAVKDILSRAEKMGFIPFDEQREQKLAPGEKLIVNHKNKAVALIVVGSEPLERGFSLVGAHLDSPRLDLKPNPLYEDGGLAKLKTHYYGGVKKYQYATIPLAIHGVVYNEKGEKIEVHIGEDPDDPVFCVSDLLIHLSKDQMAKTMREGLTGEQMNVIVGSIPVKEDDKETITANIKRLIREKYNFEEDDFRIAEIEVVPQGSARDLGLDRSMILAYGHDDRVCSFAALRAIFEVEKPKMTAIALLVDKEEIGSVGNTGMASNVLENLMHELVAASGEYCALRVNRALKNAKVLSADVTVAFDPDFAEVTEKKNVAFLGNGVALIKYTGSGGKSGTNDANVEFLQEVRAIFDRDAVVWQTGELGKVDQGGGGTIAYLISKYGAEVVDCGTPVLSMHAPYEIASKVDCYETFKAYRAFFRAL